MNYEKEILDRAARLEEARKRAGFKLAVDAAKAFGWNENTYRSHENGHRGMRFDVLDRYAKAFKINAMDIWNGAQTAPTLAHDIENEKEGIASRLRQARDAFGIKNATEAAAHFKWNIVTYRSHENGLRGLTVTVAAEYAKAYGVRLDWLVTGASPMKDLGLENQIAHLPDDQMKEVMDAWRGIMALVQVKGKVK